MLPKPLWLLAELTYRCPLQCPYCSNPLDFAGPRFHNELSTEEWQRVFKEAKALGVLQLGLSGGEPTLRPDLEKLVGAAHDLGVYQTLVTSAYRLTRDRLLNEVWGYNYFGTTRTLDQAIAQLRRKLGESNPPRWLLTVHGVGYKLASARGHP